MGLENLFGKKQEQISPAEFWRRTAEKRGAEIPYYTFAVYLGRSNDAARDLPGLLYLAGETLWFEDFEKDMGFMKIFTPKTVWEKTEFSLPKSDIGAVKIVPRKTAFACIKGWMDPGAVAPITRIGRVFSRSVVQLGLPQGAAIYFEVMKEAELVRLLQ
jgi:hypothetical protein